MELQLLWILYWCNSKNIHIKEVPFKEKQKRTVQKKSIFFQYHIVFGILGMQRKNVQFSVWKNTYQHW